MNFSRVTHHHFGELCSHRVRDIVLGFEQVIELDLRHTRTDN